MSFTTDQSGASTGQLSIQNPKSGAWNTSGTNICPKVDNNVKTCPITFTYSPSEIEQKIYTIQGIVPGATVKPIAIVYNSIKPTYDVTATPNSSDVKGVVGKATTIYSMTFSTKSDYSGSVIFDSLIGSENEIWTAVAADLSPINKNNPVCNTLNKNNDCTLFLKFNPTSKVTNGSLIVNYRLGGDNSGKVYPTGAIKYNIIDPKDMISTIPSDPKINGSVGTPIELPIQFINNDEKMVIDSVTLDSIESKSTLNQWTSNNVVAAHPICTNLKFNDKNCVLKVNGTPNFVESSQEITVLYHVNSEDKGSGKLKIPYDIAQAAINVNTEPENVQGIENGTSQTVKYQFSTTAESSVGDLIIDSISDTVNWSVLEKDTKCSKLPCTINLSFTPKQQTKGPAVLTMLYHLSSDIAGNKRTATLSYNVYSKDFSIIATPSTATVTTLGNASTPDVSIVVTESADMPVNISPSLNSDTFGWKLISPNNGTCQLIKKTDSCTFIAKHTDTDETLPATDTVKYEFKAQNVELKLAVSAFSSITRNHEKNIGCITTNNVFDNGTFDISSNPNKPKVTYSLINNSLTAAPTLVFTNSPAFTNDIWQISYNVSADGKTQSIDATLNIYSKSLLLDTPYTSTPIITINGVNGTINCPVLKNYRIINTKPNTNTN